MKQARDEWSLGTHPLHRGDSRSPTRIEEQAFTVWAPSEVLELVCLQRTDSCTRPQRSFKQYDIQSRPPNMRDIRCLRKDDGTAGPLYDAFIEQCVDANARRTHPKFDEESHNLSRHTLDPRWVLWQRQTIRVNIDIHSELPSA
jgi:hypothetical protein